jgi:hypothetical protein
MSDSPKTQCYVCKDMHYVDQCPQFKSMTAMQRWEIVKEQKTCFSCLKRSKGHTASNCLRKKKCQEKTHDGSSCKKPHHRLLHGNTSPDPRNVVGLIEETTAKPFYPLSLPQ